MDQSAQTDSSLANELVSADQWLFIAEQFELSDRELEVAKLLFCDFSREQIALRLTKSNGDALSPETVRVYIDRMYAKLAVSSPISFVQQVIQMAHDMPCHQKCDIAPSVKLASLE